MDTCKCDNCGNDMPKIFGRTVAVVEIKKDDHIDMVVTYRRWRSLEPGKEADICEECHSKFIRKFKQETQ